MNIKITIWKERGQLQEPDYTTRLSVNPVVVRYPNIGRQKGERHEIEEITDVPTIGVFRDELAINNMNHFGADVEIPDFNTIDAIIEKYRNIGDVTVCWNRDEARAREAFNSGKYHKYFMN